MAGFCKAMDLSKTSFKMKCKCSGYLRPSESKWGVLCSICCFGTHVLFCCSRTKNALSSTIFYPFIYVFNVKFLHVSSTGQKKESTSRKPCTHWTNRHFICHSWTNVKRGQAGQWPYLIKIINLQGQTSSREGIFRGFNYICTR